MDALLVTTAAGAGILLALAIGKATTAALLLALHSLLRAARARNA